MRKKVALFLLLQISILLCDRTMTVAGADDSELCAKDLEKIVEKKSGYYRVRISYTNDRACQRLDILQRNQVVFRDEGIDHHYFLGNKDGNSDKRAIINLTGRGVQLIVKKWTGGAHCCNSLLIFDLGKKFRKIAEIDTGNFDAEIVDLNQDGIPEIRVLDDFLAYRFSSFAYSAKAEVVLRYVAGDYKVAPELMKRAAPSWRVLKKKSPRWRRLLRDQTDFDWPPPSLIQVMTDLIFTGHENFAFEMLERIWPPDVDGKAGFLSSYRAALSESKYYSELKRR